MDPRKAVFVDTSVLLRLIGIDGDEAAREIAAEFDQRTSAGQQFEIPVTAIVETGNRIAQLPSDRRRFAEKLAGVLEAVQSGVLPWILRATVWNEEFVQELLDGNATGSTLVDLVGNGRLGTGDVAILVDRDQFERATAYVSVKVWSLDSQLSAYG
ncbi:hypothetical protein [Candidatus Poriferisodalis sp.]|uniref:hypothetical protein n=1 Tax=Candidatus Poriferisodalis sp. TaxID=3101277 RepID=UPI003C6F4B14